MKVTFVVPGRFKSKELEALVDHYLKLAGRFANLERVSLPIPRGASEEQSLDLALTQFLERRGARFHLTLLDEGGAVFTSRKFSAKLETILSGSHTEWIVAVGGAHGYGKVLRERAHLLWSLSPMTLPHEMAAAVAAEQIFRAFSIVNRHPYHND